MLSVIDLAIAFPGRQQRIEDAAAQLALNPTELKMFKRYYGFESFPLDDNQPFGDLLSSALSSLTARNPLIQGKLQIVALCHTISDIAPFGGNNPEDWLRGCGLDGSIEIMSLTMNHCATGLSMLTFLKAALAPDRYGILLVGEKAFHRTIRLIEDTSIMGEAVAGVLLGHGPGLFAYIGGYTTHEGGFSVISGRPSRGSLVGFGPRYYDIMVEHLRQLLAQYSLRIDDIRYVFPHNVNAASWRRIASAMGIPIEKIYMNNICRHGHCFGADPFINAADALQQGLLSVGDTVLLVCAGLGGTVSTALLSVSSSGVNGRSFTTTVDVPFSDCRR
jgi:3-oxoacyl-[acyl-carrier-protein] synthase III